MDFTTLTTNLQVPNNIVAGVASGKMLIRGGVVQHAAGTSEGGNIVGWLRESSLAPQSKANLIAPSGGGFASALSMVGGVASILNLGATIAFGVATLSKLGSMDKKLDQMDHKLDRILDQLDEMDAKLDKLQWTIELGFRNVLRGIGRLEGFLERELLANLRSASELAWSAQSLEPSSAKRDARLENALSRAHQGMEALLLQSESELEEITDTFCSKTTGRTLLSTIEPSVVKSLRVARAATAASALTARILAEQGQLAEAAKVARQAVSRLRKPVTALGKAFLRGQLKESTITYDNLLNVSLSKVGIRPGRVGGWANRFDPEVKGLEGILELLQDQSKVIGLSGKTNWPKPFLETVGHFADEIDGVWEDIDRLGGYEHEYAWADKQDMTIGDYRNLLRVDPPELDGRLLVLTPLDEPFGGIPKAS